MILLFKWRKMRCMAYELGFANLFRNMVHNDSSEVCQDIHNRLWWAWPRTWPLAIVEDEKSHFWHSLWFTASKSCSFLRIADWESEI